MKFACSILLLLLLALPATCQSMAEYTLGVSAGAAGSGAMQGVGKALNTMLEQANKTLAKGAAQGQLVTEGPAAKPASPVAQAAKPGVTGADIVAKFGPPTSKVEYWTYGSGPDAVTLTLRDGKVVSLARTERAEAPKPKPNANPNEIVIDR